MKLIGIKPKQVMISTDKIGSEPNLDILGDWVLKSEFSQSMCGLTQCERSAV